MLDVIITLFAFYGLTYIVKEASIFSRVRSWIMLKSTFMAGLLYCWFCTGFHCGWMVYMLHEPFPWHVKGLVLWALAGSAISGLFNALMERLITFPVSNFDQKKE